ncbi:hypothetical protein [Dyadobacter beijingensis]|uniref:hypothetical protein n=1 Tax=Dyadobacter beijingensis TaxID=365489 RepID=UPI00036B98CF|nr:hypothetical protein [Dyadobacter beijingensis]
MDKQQSSLNGYLRNWSLMAITSFIWLQIFSVPLASVTGIPVLQEELYVQLTASLIFYFGYCICFPGYFQRYVDSPFQGCSAIELPPQTSTQVANNRPIRLKRGRLRLRYRRLLTHLMIGGAL